MGPLEGLIIALVIIFYIVRAIVRGIQAVLTSVRKALGASTGMTDDARRQAMEQMRRSMPSQETGPRRPQERPAQTPSAPARPRRPEAGGPAVTDRTDSAEFGAQIARIEAEEGPGMPAPSSLGAAPAGPGGLFTGGDDLLRAVILQEVLAKPLSQRRRAAQYTAPPPAPRQ